MLSSLRVLSFSPLFCGPFLPHSYKTGPPGPGDGPINFFDLAGIVEEEKKKKSVDAKRGGMLGFVWVSLFQTPRSSPRFVSVFAITGSTLTITDDGKPKGSKGKKYGFMIRLVPRG